jgi:hypothetical protein
MYHFHFLKICHFRLLLAVLSLFLKQVLRFDEDMATVLYHAFTAICYFTPILGAILVPILLTSL